MTHTRFPRTVADLKPGDHVCCLYGTEEEHRAVVTPFLRQGLERIEKVLYIVDSRAAETVLGYLRDEGLDVEPYLARGQLVILTRDDAYVREGVFDPEGMIALLRAETERALADGYSALCVTGEMSWALRGLPGSERLIEYEAKLNEFFADSKCLAICQYDRRQFEAALLLDVLRTHPIAVVGTRVYENFYYIPPAQLLGPDPPAAELHYWLENLVERKWAEEALRESEERYRSLFEGVPVGLYRTTPGGQIVDGNAALVKTLGYPDLDSLLALNVADGYVKPEDRPRWQALMERQGIVRDFEVQWHRHDGSVIWVAENARAVRDGQGRVLYYEGAVRDITERKQAQEALRRQRDELAVRDRILGATLTTVDLDELLSLILDEILVLLQVECGSIHLVQKADVVLRCWQGLSDEFRAHVLCFPTTDPPGWLRQLHVVHERLSEQGMTPDFAKRDGIQSWVSIPFWLPSPREEESEWLGAIFVASRRYEALSKEQAWALEAIGDELALAIDHARIYRQAQERLSRLQTLRDIDRAVIQRLDLREVLHVVLERIPTELSGDAVAISLLDAGEFRPQVSAMRLHDGTFIDEEVFALAENLLHWFVERQEPVIIYDLTQDPRMQMHRQCIRNGRLISYLGVPLIARNKTIGILHIMTRQPKVFADEDVGFFRTMAGQAAIAIENARLYQDARQELAERKRAEEGLRESEERFRALVENASDLTMILGDDGAVHYMSPAIERVLGYRPEELTGKSGFDFMHPDDLPSAINAFSEAIRSPGTTVSMEVRMRHKDSSWRTFEAVGSNLLANPSVAGFVINAHDITERKRAEEALAYRARFERLITTISTDFVNVELDEIDSAIDSALHAIGHFTAAYRSYVFLFSDDGRTMDNTHEWCAEEIESRIQNLKELPVDDLLWGLEELKRGESVHIPCVTDLPPEAIARKEDWQWRSLQSVIAVPMMYGGSVAGFLGIDSAQEPKAWTEDIIALLGIVGEVFANALERRRAEEALQEYAERLEEMVEERTRELHDAQEELVRQEKLAALGQLARGLAHELNNPLTGVVMYAQRLLQKAEQEELVSNPALRVFPESLRAIEEATLRCRDIVRDLLTLARPDWGGFVPLQVNEVVEAALRPMKAQLSNGQVRLKLDLQPNLPPLMGNANWLRQVFANLIFNAQQAMPEGGELAISTRLVDGQRVQVQVGDTGCGIPEEIRSRIFEPFFTTRPAGQGTGLGLSISHRIIEAHQGSIDVESTPGVGSTFTVTLPLPEEQADG